MGVKPVPLLRSGIKKKLGTTNRTTYFRKERPGLSHANNSPVAADRETLHLSQISVSVAPPADNP